MKILITAYACEPYRGSEAGTAWNIVCRLAATHEVTVVTRANNSGVIDKYLIENSIPRLSFLYVDPPNWTLCLKKLGLLTVQLFYFLWQLAVTTRLQKEFRRQTYDVYHHISFNSFEVPPFSALFIGQTPFVWGPVGGGQTVSVNMLNWFGTKGKLIEVLRNFRVQISAYNPLCILVLKKAHLVYFANQETQELLARWCGGRHEMMIDVGVDITKFSDKDQKKKTGDITQILFAGSIEPRKGGALLLSAMSRLKQINNRFVCKIVGDGPDKSALEKSSELLGLEKNVIFMGRVSHDEMNRVFSEADVFTFPSLRDTSGAIVLEAMAMEIPTVCIDHQGAAIMVDKTSGLKIAPDSPDKMAEAIAVAISSLMEDDVICKKMGIAARERVTQEYDWSVRVQRTDEDYQELVC